MKKLRDKLKIKLLEMFSTNNEYIEAKKHKYTLKWEKDKVRNKILSFYENTSDKEIQEVLSFFKTNEIQMIPYEYTKKYSLSDVQVNTEDGYPYVEIDGHKVFFPQNVEEKRIKRSVNTALIEQSERSPHKYLTDEFNIDNSTTAVLIGASDGIFALSILDKVDKIYLFEPDERWIEPLKRTFAFAKDKVEIISKFVADFNDANTVTLDSFFAGKEAKIGYIQMDVEGMEEQVLNGAKNILQNQNLKLSICCYHNQSDEAVFTKLLKEYNFSVTPSYGYILLLGQPFVEPYLRRGVLYASKNSN